MSAAASPALQPAVKIDRRVAEAVCAGLTAQPKRLPAWLFYDAEGSRFFEAITELPEYYLTRTERSILAEHAAKIVAQAAGDSCLRVVELPLEDHQVRQIDGMRVVAEPWLLAYSLLRHLFFSGKIDPRYRKILTRLLSDPQSGDTLKNLLADAVGRPCAINLLEALDDPALLAIAARPARRSFLRKSFLRRPLASTGGLFRHALLLARRFFAYPGLLVVLLGEPAAIDALAQGIEDAMPEFGVLRPRLAAPTLRSFRIASAASKTAAPSASSSSSGITKSTATPASPYSPRPWFISAMPRWSWPTVRWCSIALIKPTRTASFGSHPNRYPCPRRFGSTSRCHPARRQTKVVSKLPCWVSQNA